MVSFCPLCGNMLMVRTINGNEYYCDGCPYKFPIKSERTRTSFKRKKVDDVLGGEKAWENVDQADAQCPKCQHHRAYFMQIQTRSADEPMTTFYKCVKCGTQWREQ
ncbi:hypothetical protein M427DRAFT_96347 [Gonapodya prolifera JEL478]|uniref:DNA-directed RNA polymerase subunit n=1 Tax=Gonapodya prolifera (strain JEL478) TaxID=1344416 RepID=A0A139AN53_GONPJ|nr:hypothetical protein M427DRAFT_96347 [Gonapodya prolifera JEL478]|eukprot:KXS18190.1 hypothetical protein M427DRAFT_96347 [Gonapodya prolifera JEL478]